MTASVIRNISCDVGFLEAYSQLKRIQSHNETFIQCIEDLPTALIDVKSTHNSLMADSLTNIE